MNSALKISSLRLQHNVMFKLTLVVLLITISGIEFRAVCFHEHTCIQTTDEKRRQSFSASLKDIPLWHALD